VASGKAESGYVISSLGPYLAQQRFAGKLDFLPGGSEADAFPICAAVRKSDAELKAAIDRAWEELERKGELARVFERWHIPYRPATAADVTKRGPHVD
jgi:ABC-type amino acid transport substrate-binding protein